MDNRELWIVLALVSTTIAITLFLVIVKMAFMENRLDIVWDSIRTSNSTELVHCAPVEGENREVCIPLDELSPEELRNLNLSL